jgi:cyclopropane fatty-acyl-phospholipid synthase-like methyltransferase
MNTEPAEITDSCRKGLIKYLIKAISIIPDIERPFILDIGCGTGVTTLTLADIYTGIIYAVDSNKKSLSRLEEKIKSLNLSKRVITIHSSVFDLKLTDVKFDIILAEGLLNIIGFENGLFTANKYIRENGYFIIHDEIADQNEKLKIMERNGYKLLGSFELNEDIWWNDYYKKMEKEISSYDGKNIKYLFKKELDEIEMYKKNPARFRSMYYILKKQKSK